MIKLTEQDIKWYNEGQKQIEILKLTCNGKIVVFIENGYPQTNGIRDFIFDYGFLDLFNKPDSPWQEGFKKFMKGQCKKFHSFVYGKNLWWVCVEVAHNGVSGEVKIPMDNEMLEGYIRKYLASDRSE